MRRLVGIVSLVGPLLFCSAVAAAAAGGPIGNNQHFIGLVNGHPANAVVYTVCPGPAGQKGHPSGGQSFSVRQVTAGGGYTDNIGGGIFARFASNPRSEGVLFTVYDKPGPIPTSWTVPCQGSGEVIFQPIPIVGSSSATGQAHARSYVVQVRFENIAA